MNQVETYVRKFFSDGRRRKIWPSDVAMALKIDYAKVRAAFEELEHRGIVKKVKP